MHAVQLNSSEPPPVATMQIQISEAPSAEAAQGHQSSLSSLLSDPSHVQQVRTLAEASPSPLPYVLTLNGCMCCAMKSAP